MFHLSQDTLHWPGSGWAHASALQRRIDGGKKSNGGASGQSHCSNIVRDFDLNMPVFECPEDIHEVLDDQLLECDEDFDDQPSCDEDVNEVLDDQALGCDEDIDLNIL
ncbi:Hypothetical predicted protein [Olea europaea subsp. europaea]|uniref:Uncharacterized protein n=1 Tax=Olea europaea subsp. europaea TaxID=158383 RepID=A0A8S0VIE4_OLEEU|nr:Hypothetical predicted protein [Olea europaea subsp. europaea]